MSTAKIRAALETRLDAVNPPLATAWENMAFVPPAATVPYQRAFILWATPVNQEFGSSHFEEGIFQVNLLYPLQTGAKAATARAELLRAAFMRGSSLTSSGVTVSIVSTAEISQGTVDGDRWLQPVKIRISAFIP